MTSNEIIKDSGSTQEFDTGAHRDNPVGKGRCDLLPMDVVSMVMFDDPVFANINLFMENRDITYIIKAIRESATTVPLFHYDNIYRSLAEEGIQISCVDSENPDEVKRAMVNACLAHMMIESSKQFEAGAVKYQPNNWKLGMPVNRYIDSGMRHYLKTLRGDIDEPHYRGFIWNLLCAVWTCQNKPELNFKEEPKRSN